MCGIVGAASTRDVSNILLEGLKRLEYRGYDSAGIAVLNESNKIKNIRCEGKVNSLAQKVQKKSLKGTLGIAHTRWATHGKPCESNAHPHVVNKIALVHNGIIENFEHLKESLQKEGAVFKSETDSEVIAHLISSFTEKGKNLIDSVKLTTKKLQGAYSIAVISEEEPKKFIVARHGSPLVIGLGIGENFIGSDALALQTVTNRFMYLEDGDVASVSADNVEITDKNKKTIKREIVEYNLGQDSAEKGKYRHYMEKEIFEQPKSVLATLENRVSETKVLKNIFCLGSEELF